MERVVYFLLKVIWLFFKFINWVNLVNLLVLVIVLILRFLIFSLNEFLRFLKVYWLILSLLLLFSCELSINENLLFFILVKVYEEIEESFLGKIIFFKLVLVKVLILIVFSFEVLLNLIDFNLELLVKVLLLINFILFENLIFFKFVNFINDFELIELIIYLIFLYLIFLGILIVLFWVIILLELLKSIWL